MPSGPLWDELTDKEKLNVLHYLLSSSSSDVIRNIFEDIEEDITGEKIIFAAPKPATARPVAKNGLSCDHCFKTVVRPRFNDLFDMVMSGNIPEED